ncbi:Similar to Golga1: Golgin subfamily A member 1 (Mus musculus) [Cotesia congregata]|uniref:Similar to Golga1: Golgin subfamily A member 1 (Mus musculus) n=2 Tax=Cotesia TaxID=32390 RepID=A0A8J2HIW4_COTCN|nr:Similar to Golga1: Golgin subfamily A member 1 (Mus musculus) [Cotesia congregata]
MFASLKNKIGKEIGNDVTAVVRHAGSVRGINSRHVSQTGSSSSVSGSQLSLDESQESAVSPTINIKRENSFELKLNDGTELSSKDIKRLESREDEWRKRLAKKELECQKKLDKKDEEWKIRMFEREKEWKKNVEKLEKDKQKLEDGRLKAESAKQLLETALRDAEEYKKKLYSFQEDAEQLEGFQTQEMAKIKHLLLAKEQEVEEKTHNLKAALAEIDNLKTELSRLRRYEQELNDIQDKMESLRHTTQREKSQLTGDLEHTKEEVRHLLTKVSVLEQRLALESNDQSTVDDRIADLMRERTLLERKLEETHLHLSDIKTSWSSTISNLETQVGRLSRQAGEEGLERRRVEEENDKLKLRMKQLEENIEVNNVVMATKDAKLLRMAESIDEMATELKELRASVDDEVEEFKRQIESSSKEIESLKEELEEAAKKLTNSASELTALKSSYEAEKENNSTLHMQLARLRESLEAERTNSATLRVNLEKEQSEKDSALLRNAQMSQNFEIAKQEQRTQEIENIELQTRLESLEESLKAANSLKDVAVKDSEEMKNRIIQLEAMELDRKLSQDTEQSLKNNLANLEDQINDKNKTIKVLQQRLADMKKTLQRELRVPSSSFDNDDSAAILTPSSSKTVTAKHPNSQEEDVNFKYLKHVLIKFLTSREYEALHLTRAVATLLHFSPEEERLLQETLEWKMSWFGTRPNLGFGQTAKAIPPS